MLTIPRQFNAAAWFVDRNVTEGRANSVAMESGEEQVTYGELLERVNRTGNALREVLGVRIEERVLLLLLDTPEFFYGFFGAVKIGAVPVPVNTLLRSAEYLYVLNDSRARVAMVSEALLPQLLAFPRDQLPYLQTIVVVGQAVSGTLAFSDLLNGNSPHLEPANTTKDDVAFWLYSSGSTGAPKGCIHLHHDMVVCAEHYARGILCITEHDRCFSVAKMFFAYGLGNALYCPLAVGATSILLPGKPTPANIYEVIERYRPTLFYSVPTSYAQMLSFSREGPDFDLSSIRHAVSAGESLPAAIFERFKTRFGVEILDGLGSTEILHIFISNRPGAIKPGSSGQVVPGYEAKLLDDGGAEVGAGEIGNLYVKGDSTCAAYWNQHEATKNTIQGQWIRTGDKYSRDADGYFWYAGRSDDMLKVGGKWLSPIEVENVLIEHEAVAEAAVVGVTDSQGLTHPVAYVVLRPAKEASEQLAQELRDFVGTRLAGYKRPQNIEFVDDLPKTATGKLQRFRLREKQI
ncbi:MAG: benzoate-CoA ligase family protein [Terriglobales bacterium]|jgi:benzoate-CoA ligase